MGCRISFALILISFLVWNGKARATDESCPLRWERLINPPILALASDTVYYGIRLVPTSDDVAWVLEASMPDARYVSLTSYEPNANAWDSLIDAAITREADGIGFKVAVVAPGSDSSRLSVPLGNRLLRPSLAAAKVAQHGVTIWYRAYVPYTNPEELLAPTIQAYDLKTGARVSCPRVLTPSSPVDALAVKKAAALPEKSVTEGLIDSFHVSADFDYQNRENGYLNAAVKYRGSSDIALFRFLAPKASTNYSALRPDSSWSEADVRLYSVSLINGLGINRVTRHDSEFPLTVDPDSGLSSAVTLLLADPNDTELMAFAKSRGYLVLPRASGFFAKDTLIYRQQAANPFAGRVREFVPLCRADNKEYPAACAGRCFVGSYAPRGRLCTKAEVLADQCRVDLINDQGCS